MKYTALLIAIMILLWTASTFAQQLTESQRLTAEALTLVDQKDYAGAVNLLDRAVKIERTATPRNNRNLGTLLVNLARIKLAQARQHRTSTSPGSIGPVTLIQRLPIDDEINAHYTEAMNVFETLLPGEPGPWTTAAHEYGSFLKRMPSASSYETSDFEKVEGFYKSAVGRLTKTLGADSDSTLKFVVALADLYHGSSEYERAFPLYQRFVKATEARTDNRTSAVDPFRKYVQILVVSGQTTEAEAYVTQIAAITGRPEQLPVIDITSRQINRNHLEIFDLLGKAKTAKPKSVWVDLVIDESGNVKEAKPEPNTYFDQKGKSVVEVAEKAARSWKFKRLVIDGVRRKTYGRVAFSFVPKE